MPKKLHDTRTRKSSSASSGTTDGCIRPVDGRFFKTYCYRICTFNGNIFRCLTAKSILCFNKSELYRTTWHILQIPVCSSTIALRPQQRRPLLYGWHATSFWKKWPFTIVKLSFWIDRKWHVKSLRFFFFKQSVIKSLVNNEKTENRITRNIIWEQVRSRKFGRN